MLQPFRSLTACDRSLGEDAMTKVLQNAGLFAWNSVLVVSVAEPAYDVANTPVGAQYSLGRNAIEQAFTGSVSQNLVSRAARAVEVDR